MLRTDRIVEAVILIDDRRQTNQRISELLVLATTTAGVLVNQPQLSEKVVGSRVKFCVYFRLGQSD
jgi:hypothetical protein